MFSVNTVIDFYLHYQPQVFHIVFLCLNQLLQHIPAGDTKRRNDYKLFQKIKNSVFLHKSHPNIYIYFKYTVYYTGADQATTIYPAKKSDDIHIYLYT